MTTRSSFAPLSAFTQEVWNQQITTPLNDQTLLKQVEPEFMSQYKHLIYLLNLPSKNLRDTEQIYSSIENHPYLKKFFGENISDKSAALHVLSNFLHSLKTKSNKGTLLCKNMSVQFFKRGDIVMAQGDQSDNKLYVILEGKVGIIINFKGAKPPDGAIYDRELQEKLEKELQEKNESQEDKIDEELFKRIISIFKKEKEDDKKKYIPFGEDPEMKKRAAVHKNLIELIENKDSVLKPKHHHIHVKKHFMEPNRGSLYSPSLFKPSFQKFIDFIREKKNEKIMLENKLLQQEGSDGESVSSKLNDTKKNSISSACDTPRMRKQREEQQENKERKYQQQIESFGVKVNEIGKGTGFGDKALLAPNPKLAVRNATIICTTPVLCIVVYRKDFLRVVENFSMEAIFKEKTITKEFKFFKDVSSTSLKERLLYYFQDINLLKNDYLCKEGEGAEGFYILAEGKVTLSKKLEDASNIYYQKYQNICICTIERPTFFCEEIIFNKDEKQKCKYTIQVTSQKAHLFYCSKQNFLYKFPKDAIAELQTFHLAKDQSYSQLFENSKQIQLNNNQIKKQNEKSINDNAHYMNYQQNKELFNQMKSTCIDYQVKKVIPKLIDQFENQQNQSQLLNKIKLNEDFDPAIQDFCSKVDIVMRKNLEEREMVKKIIKQKKIRTDKRTFKQKQSVYRYGNQISQNDSSIDDQDSSQINNDSSSDSNQKSDVKLSVDSEEKIKLLRNYFSKGNKQNLEDVDLSLFYNTQDELYQDTDVNLLLDIRKPKKNFNKYLHKKPSEIHDSSENNAIQSTNGSNNSGTPNKSQQLQLQLQQGDMSPRRKNSDAKPDYSNFEADELKTPPPEQSKTLQPIRTKLNQHELDIGYLDQFKKQQYFYMVRKGAIKINQNTEFPQLDLRKKILKKYKKRKCQATAESDRFSYSFSLVPQHSQHRMLRNSASYDVNKDEILRMNNSNITDITQNMNEDNLLTDRTDFGIKSKQLLDNITSKFDELQTPHSGQELKSPLQIKSGSSKKSSFKDLAKGSDKQQSTTSIHHKNSLKFTTNVSNPIQITEEFKQFDSQESMKNVAETLNQNIIAAGANKIDFTDSQESFPCFDKGGFYSPKNLQISSIISPKNNQFLQDQLIGEHQNEGITSIIQSKKNSEVLGFQIKNSPILQAIQTKGDTKTMQFSSIASPTGVGSRLNGLNGCVVQPKIVSEKNLQKKDHQFYLTTRNPEEIQVISANNANNNNAFTGNPNNFQIVSFSYQLKQLQLQQNQVNSQTAKKSKNDDTNTINRTNKYLKNALNQQVHQNSAPNIKRPEQVEQNEFYFKQNFMNHKTPYILSNQNQSANIPPINTSKNNFDNKGVNQSQTFRNFQKCPRIDTQKKPNENSPNQNQPHSPGIASQQAQSNFNQPEQMTPISCMNVGKNQKLMNELDRINFPKTPTIQYSSRVQQLQMQEGIRVSNSYSNSLTKTFSNEDILKAHRRSYQETDEVCDNAVKTPSCQMPQIKKRNTQSQQTQSANHTNFKTMTDNNNNSSDNFQNLAPLNQTGGAFTFKNHLKKVFVNRQKIFKVDNHLKPAHTYTQPLNQKELKLSPYFSANSIPPK